MRNSHKRAVQKYNAANYDQIVIRVPKGERDIFRDLATYNECSLAEYMRRAAYLTSDIADEVCAAREYDGWSLRIEHNYLTAERDTEQYEEVSSYEWRVLPLTADRLAKIYNIIANTNEDSTERARELVGMMDGAKDMIFRESELECCAYLNDDRDACFNDGWQEYYTTELLDDDRIGIDLDGVHWYFKEGSTKPVKVKEFIVRPSYYVL